MKMRVRNHGDGRKLKLLGRVPSMVEILCPHCEEEIALDDDA